MAMMAHLDLSIAVFTGVGDLCTDIGKLASSSRIASLISLSICREYVSGNSRGLAELCLDMEKATLNKQLSPRMSFPGVPVLSRFARRW